MSSLRLTMFGAFQVRDSAGRKVAVSGIRPCLLLALLALRPGEAHTRERLMARLWSDRGEAQARSSLRQALWTLRNALEGVEPNPLIVEGETLTLDPAAIVTDVLDFERNAADGSPAALQSAVDAYQVNLLVGLHTRDAAMDDFLRDERQRLHEIAVDACTKLLEYRLRRGRDDAVAETAKRMLAIDPLQEAAYRALMEHYAAKQQIGLALKQYQACKETLRRALDIDPSPETEQLFERIRLAEPMFGKAAPYLSTPMQPTDAFSVLYSGKPSIAVLPFVNRSDEAEQEYFSDGITEDIITALSKLRWFLVIARNSTFVYKNVAVDIKAIGRELGVQYILEGSVRKAGTSVRISAQLVDVVSGTHIWAQNYDRELTDIFALQDDITQSVTAAIEPKLVAAEALRSQTRAPEDLGAWDLVMRALSHYWRMTTPESETAIGMLREAVERYPGYGPAHSLLAFALLVSGHVGWIAESKDYAYAAELAQRAVVLDDEDPWAHLALGYLAFTKRKTNESVRECLRSLDFNPNFSTAYGYLGWALVFDGQSAAAIRYFQQALRMSPYDPLNAFFYSGTCVAHYYEHRYEKAIEWGRRAISERPGFAAAQRILCASLAQAGRIAETQEAMARLRDMQPNISIAWIEQHVPYTEPAMPHFLDGMRKAGLD